MSAARLVMCSVLVACGGGVWAQATKAPDFELARARDPGIVTLIRHAAATGTDEPAGFTIDDCSTQAPLSEEGRDYARRLGWVWRSVGVREADVRSSRRCRCLETATLLGVGTVREATYLDVVLAGPAEDTRLTRELRAAIVQKLDSRRPTILVTHPAAIAALTGIVPDEGEVTFVRATAAGTIEVVARTTFR